LDFGGLTVSGATNGSASSGGGLDMFGLIEAKALSSSVKVGSDGMSASMRTKLSALPKSREGEQTLGSDDRLHVSAFKVLPSDRTIAVLMVTNKASAPVSVTLNVTAHAGFVATFDGEPGPQTRAGSSSNATVVGLSNLAGGTTATLLIGLQCRDFSAAFASAPQLTFSATTGSGAPLAFSLAVTVPELLRPAAMTTPQYGAYWKQYTAEAKFPIPDSGCRTSADFMGRVKNDLSIYPVQTIGVENIVAGKLVSAATVQLLCFVHGKVTLSNPSAVTA